MMDKDLILKQEGGNDGQRIFLFYDDLAGLYLAFGQSAYYTTMVAEPYMSYSEELRMPVALLRREHILNLRQSLKKIEHTQKCFYQFQMRQPIGDAGYGRWAENIRSKHERIYR